MSLKAQVHSNDKASAKQKLPKPATESLDILAQQQAHPATIIQRARRDPRSLTPSDVLQLQRTIGNQAIGQHLAGTIHSAATTKGVVQRNPFNYSSNRLNNGELLVKVEANLISATGSFEDIDGQEKSIVATLEYKVDADNEKRIIIGNIKSTPKRTGTGSILVYHLARIAREEGVELIGTDLSALEEGTPEFYRSIGLAPDPSPEVQEAIAAMSREAQEAESAEEREAIISGMERSLWAGKLNGSVEVVYERAVSRLTDGHWTEQD